MQLSGLVAFIMAQMGDLTNLIASAVAQWGSEAAASSTDPELVNDITIGIFGEKDGLIYWLKDDFIYLVTNLGSEVMAERLTNFIAALIVGSGALEGFEFYVNP